jgi:hypothetical protein
VIWSQVFHSFIVVLKSNQGLLTSDQIRMTYMANILFMTFAKRHVEVDVDNETLGHEDMLAITCSSMLCSVLHGKAWYC